MPEKYVIEIKDSVVSKFLEFARRSGAIVEADQHVNNAYIIKLVFKGITVTVRVLFHEQDRLRYCYNKYDSLA